MLNLFRPLLEERAPPVSSDCWLGFGGFSASVVTDNFVALLGGCQQFLTLANGFGEDHAIGGAVVCLVGGAQGTYFLLGRSVFFLFAEALKFV
jgi:hypothetical protein